MKIKISIKLVVALLVIIAIANYIFVTRYMFLTITNYASNVSVAELSEESEDDYSTFTDKNGNVYMVPSNSFLSDDYSLERELMLALLKIFVIIISVFIVALSSSVALPFPFAYLYTFSFCLSFIWDKNWKMVHSYLGCLGIAFILLSIIMLCFSFFNEYKIKHTPEIKMLDKSSKKFHFDIAARKKTLSRIETKGKKIRRLCSTFLALAVMCGFEAMIFWGGPEEVPESFSSFISGCLEFLGVISQLGLFFLKMGGILILVGLIITLLKKLISCIETTK